MADGMASKAARRDLRDKTRQGHRTTTKRAFAFQLPTANKRQRLAAGEDDDQYHDDEAALDNGASAPSPPPSPAQLGIGVPTSLSPATPITYRPRRSPGTSRTTPTSADPVTPQLSFQSIEDASPIPPPTVSHAVASLLPPLPATTRATSIRVQHPPPAATSTSTSSTTKRPYKRRDQSTATATATPLPIDIDEPLSGPLQSRRQMASRRGGFDVIAPHLTSTIDAYRKRPGIGSDSTALAIIQAFQQELEAALADLRARVDDYFALYSANQSLTEANKKLSTEILAITQKRQAASIELKRLRETVEAPQKQRQSSLELHQFMSEFEAACRSCATSSSSSSSSSSSTPTVAEQFNEAENAEAVLLGAQDAQGQLEHLRTINKLLQVCKSRLELL